MLLKKLINYRDGKGLAYKMREKRGLLLKQYLLALANNNENQLTILDIGGTEVFWRSVGYDFLRSHGVQITLVNLHKVEITMPDIFRSEVGNGCSLHYGDKQFDLAFSNSVIEHVGGHKDMLYFAAETRRVGKSFFVQTPNFWFPIEPHFLFLGFQFLPEWTRAFLLRCMPIGHFPRAESWVDAMIQVQSARLIGPKTLLELFPGSILLRERFLYFTKSITARSKF